MLQAMQESEDVGDLLSALMAAQAQFDLIVKTADGYNYKYATLPDVQDALIPVLRTHGLMFTHQNYGDQLCTKLWHVPSGQFLASYSPLDVGAGPQVFGSSQTYMRRYAEVAMVDATIIGEDEDGKRAQDHADKPPPPRDEEAQAKIAALMAELDTQSERLFQFAGAEQLSGAPQDIPSMRDALREAAKAQLGLSKVTANDADALISLLKTAVLAIPDGTIGFEGAG